MESRLNEEKILEHFKSIINDLTCAEWDMLKGRLDKVYENEKRESTYTLKVDTSAYSNIKHIYNIY